MTANRTTDYLVSVVNELIKLPRETEWVEFKRNKADPEEIGEYISALANAAALTGKTNAYLVWGVEDSSHALVGTSFDPASTKVGAEELENWLLRLLDPRIHFRFDRFQVGDTPLVMLEIGCAVQHPVCFKGQEFIRIGSYKQKLKDYPEIERELWRTFEQTPFERLLAAENLAVDNVLRLLDYPAYFELLHMPLPESRDGILSALEADAMVRRNDGGGWDVTNLGAVLFAKQLAAFGALGRKAVRVIEYEGKGRTRTLHEQEGAKGYATGFEGLIGYINDRVPPNEVIEQALRKSVPMYPELAIRELVANAIIHQDLCITGAGPTVEIFQDRIEITNPGAPLIEPNRFLDSPPRSRNEALASFLRRVGVCEERGSGIDKVVFETEVYQLPAPIFEMAGDNTIAVLFAHRPLTKMDKNDRVRACYLPACLRYVERDFMTNSTLRERFGIASRNSAQASRLIKEAISAEVIRPYDPDAAKRDMKYVPWWA